MKRISWYLCGLMLLLVACHDESLYDPNYNPSLNVVVPENFDWSTTNNVKVDVTVNDLYSGKFNYNVSVYTAPPAEGVLPVSVGIADAYNPYSAEVTLPATVKKLWIKQTLRLADGTENSTVKEVSVDGDKAVCHFAAGGKSVRSDSKGTTLTLEQYYPKDSEINHKVIISENRDLTSADLKNKTCILVKSGYTLNIPEGVWSVDPSDKSNHTWLIVEPGAKITGTNINIGSQSELLNDGDISLTGTIIFSNKAIVRNNGCIYADVVHFDNTGNMSGEEQGIWMFDYSYIGCNTMKMTQNTEIQMATGSWIRVKNALSIEHTAVINPKEGAENVDGSNYAALIQAGKITFDKNNSSLTVDKAVLVECSDEASQANMNGVASKTKNANGLITIAGTACSGGYGNETEFNLGTYTYAMEDMYPAAGDYDMNDVVLVVDHKGKARNGYVTEVTLHCTLLATGATKTISGYMQLDGVPAGDVSGDKKVSGTEYAVVSLFESSHALLEAPARQPVNTDKQGATVAAKTWDATLTFLPNSFESSQLKIENMNFFIKADGMEIHLPSYKAMDGSAPGYKTQTEIWGIRIPGTFRYPIESVRISEAYPLFSDWVSSNKGRSIEWYREPNEELIYN